MKIGDEVFVHGYVDEIRKDVIIIRNNGGYFGTIEGEIDRKIKRTLERVETDSQYVGDCESCRYTDKDTDEEPCKSCNHNTGNVNRYEQYVPDCPWK